MALDRDDGGNSDGADSPVRAGLSQQRQADYDGVLAGLESGDDAKPAKAPKAKQSPPSPGKDKGASETKGRSFPVSDAPDVSDDDDDLDESDLEGLDDESGIVPGTEDKKAQKPDKSEPEDDDEDDDDPEEDDDDEEDEEEDAEEDTDADSPAAKAKLQREKAVRAIAQAEKRAKARDAERRAAFERERSAFIREWEPQVARAREVTQLVSQAESDPIGTLERFAEEVCKLKGDDFEAAAQTLFRRSPRGAAQPGTRDAAQRARDAAALRAKQSSLEEELQNLKQAVLQKDQAEANQRAATGYLNSVVGQVGRDSPLVRRLLRRTPEEGRKQLHELAVKMADETGEVPKPRRLVRELEKRQRASLRALGIDPDTVVTKKATEATPATTKKTAGKAKPAKTPANGSDSPLTGAALRAQVERELRNLDS